MDGEVAIEMAWPLSNPKEQFMTYDKAKEVDTDRELAIEELDAISGGLVITESRVHVYELNPQPLPP